MLRALIPLAMALAACGGVDEGKKVDAGTDPPVAAGATAPPATPATPAPRALVVGNKAELANGDTVQVHSYTPAVTAANRFAKPAAGTAFAVIDVEGCARQASPMGVANPFAFALQMPDNTRTEPTFQPVASPELHSGAQAPGDCIRGNVAFEVPDGAKPVAVVFSGFGTSVKWSIP